MNYEEEEECKWIKAEHQTLSQILFLNECIKSGKIPEDIPNFESFCTSGNSKIRQLALRICWSRTKLISRLFNIDDPSSSIRKVMVRNSRSIQEIAVFFKDCNPEVKIAALKSILSLKLSEEEQNRYAMDFVALVNDREYEVRLLFAKCLKKFDSLQENILVKLFDKEDIGTLIYAAEEEYEDIRKEAMSSLPYILKEDVATVGFDFLIDVLGDDSLAVREIAMKSMYKICKKFTIKKDSGSLSSILNCLREMSPVLKKYLLKIIRILHYEEPSIINCLFNTKLEDLEILKTIDEIVKRNRRIFEIAVLRSYYVFSTEEDRKTYRMKYLADLVILRKICKRNSILVNEKTKMDWKMTDGLLKKNRTPILELEKVQEKIKVFIDRMRTDGITETLVEENKIKRTKHNVISNVSNNNNELDSVDNELDSANNDLNSVYINLSQTSNKSTILFTDVLQTEIRKLRLGTSFGKFLKGFISDLSNNQENIFLIPLKFCTKKDLFKKLSKKYKISLDNKKHEVSLGCLGLIFELIETLKKNSKILCLKEYKFECPYVIRRTKGCPIEFHVECAFENTNKNIFLVLESGSSKLFYKIEPVVHIILDNYPSSFISYIACKVGSEENEHLLSLTPKIVTKIL